MAEDQKKSFRCKYCIEATEVRLIRKGTVFYCPTCETLYSNCPEIRAQLTQAGKKHNRRQREEWDYS